MSEEYGNDFISIVDEDGEEFELEHIKTFEMDGQLYMTFLPADMDEDDEDYGYIILKVIEEDGEELFGSVDDEDELERAYSEFVMQYTFDLDNQEEE